MVSDSHEQCILLYFTLNFYKFGGNVHLVLDLDGHYSTIHMISLTILQGYNDEVMTFFILKVKGQIHMTSVY